MSPTQKGAEPAPSTISGSVVKVDFGQTSNSGLVEKGIYQVKVVSAVAKMSAANQPMVVFTFEILNGEFMGRRLYLNNSLQPHALFGFRKSLEALGVKVPTSSMQVDLKKLAGAQMNVEVDHEEYNGTIKAKVVDQAPIHYDESPEGAAEVDGAPTPAAVDPQDPETDI
jgi:hypothetical protein